MQSEQVQLYPCKFSPISHKISKRKPWIKKQDNLVINKRRPWTKKEDSIIVNQINNSGKKNWKDIASQLQGRTGKQVRERYIQILDPNIIKTKFTPEEDDKIVQLISQYGAKWKTISEQLSHRSDNQIKNRFYTHIKNKILLQNPEKYEDLLQKLKQEQQDYKQTLKQKLEQQNQNPEFNNEKKNENPEQSNVIEDNKQNKLNQVQQYFDQRNFKMQIKIEEEKSLHSNNQLLTPIRSALPFNLPQLKIFKEPAIPGQLKHFQQSPQSAATSPIHNQHLFSVISTLQKLFKDLQEQTSDFWTQFYAYQRLFPEFDFKKLFQQNQNTQLYYPIYYNYPVYNYFTYQEQK